MRSEMLLSYFKELKYKVNVLGREFQRLSMREYLSYQVFCGTPNIEQLHQNIDLNNTYMET